MTKEYFRIELDITFNKEFQTYERNELKMHWREPPTEPPYTVVIGTDIIILADHLELKNLIEQATMMAVPIALNQQTENLTDSPGNA